MGQYSQGNWVISANHEYKIKVKALQELFQQSATQSKTTVTAYL